MSTLIVIPLSDNLCTSDVITLPLGAQVLANTKSGITCTRIFIMHSCLYTCYKFSLICHHSKKPFQQIILHALSKFLFHTQVYALSKFLFHTQVYKRLLAQAFTYRFLFLFVESLNVPWYMVHLIGSLSWWYNLIETLLFFAISSFNAILYSRYISSSQSFFPQWKLDKILILILRPQ